MPIPPRRRRRVAKKTVTPVLPVRGKPSGKPARRLTPQQRQAQQRQAQRRAGAQGKAKAKARTRKKAPAPIKKPDPLLERARSVVSAELDPQIAELRRQIGENTTVGTQAMDRVRQMFGFAGQATEQNRFAAEQAYDTGESNISRLYQEAAQDTAQRFADAQSAADAEQARLGIPIDNSDMSRDAAYLSGLNTMMGKAAEGNLKARGIDTDAMFRRLSAGIQADSAGRQTDIANDMNSLGRELSSQAGILGASRKAKVQSLFGELKDQQAAARAEAAQQDFLNQMAARKLGVSEKQLAANIAKMRGDQKIAIARIRTDARLERAKLKLTRKKNESDAAYKARMAAIAANNSTTRAREAAIRAENAKVERDLKRSQTMENIADTQSKQNKPGSGYDAARNYIAKNTKGMPGGSRVANNIKSILTIYTPARAKSIEARGGDLWSAIRRSKYYQSLPNSAKGMVVQAYQIAYGKIE